MKTPGSFDPKPTLDARARDCRSRTLRELAGRLAGRMGAVTAAPRGTPLGRPAAC